MDISVTDFSAPIRVSVLKFCVHLKDGKVYFVNENQDANPHFAFFQSFNFSFCHSYIRHMDIFSSQFSQKLLDLEFEIFNKFVFSLKVL